MNVFMIDYQQIYPIKSKIFNYIGQNECIKQYQIFFNFYYLNSKITKNQRLVYQESNQISFRNLNHYQKSMEKHFIPYSSNSISSMIKNRQLNEDIIQLYTALQKLQTQNKILYQSILVLNKNFNYDLYSPQKQDNLPLQVQRELKLKQIDTLLQEQSQLSKRKEQAVLKNKFIQEKKARGLANSYQTFTYSYIKRLFSYNKANSDACQRIDDINNIVQSLKNKIKKQINLEEENHKSSKNSFQNLYVPYKKYEKLQYKCKELQLQNKALNRQNKHLNQLLNEKQNFLKNIIIQNSHYLKKQGQASKKIRQLNENLKEKEKIIANNSSYAYIIENPFQKIKLLVYYRENKDRKQLKTTKNIVQMLSFFHKQLQAISIEQNQSQMSIFSSLKTTKQTILSQNSISSIKVQRKKSKNLENFNIQMKSKKVQSLCELLMSKQNENNPPNLEQISQNLKLKMPLLRNLQIINQSKQSKINKQN